jgi:glycosyltransferase involved in cell wall biosynthesis
MTASLHITWLCPDDKGGGVVSVAQSCCRQAALAGHEVTLLLALAPTGHAAEFGGVTVASLQSTVPYADIPARLVAWLAANPQDILVLNGCEQADAAIPYLPATTRVTYGVHDTAERYFAPALKHEAHLDAIVAVSETVAARFRHRLKRPDKLTVIHNGTVFPIPLAETLATSRANDLVFVGGDNPVKGALDVMALWPSLVAAGFGGSLHWFGHVGPELQAQIRQLPHNDRILIHGRQQRRAIFEAASRAKVVLMLSRVEPFGMVTVECMGMGCLAVAWDIATGTKEIVRDGEGLFVPLGDTGALAPAVLEAIAHHPQQFAGMTRRIRQDFGEAAMWSGYDAMITTTMQSGRAKRPLAGQTPPPYRPPLRLFQLLPASVRATLRTAVGKSARLGYALRDFRGR